MLITTEVEMHWHNLNKQWYESKGYTFTKLKDLFIVKVEDLPSQSNVSVEYKCENCGSIVRLKFYTYNNAKNHLCHSCSVRLKTSEALRLDFDIVKKPFEERGYLLLTTKDEYKNSRQKLFYICPKHPDEIQSICYSSINNGNGCRFCGLETTKEKLRINFNIIKQLFYDCNYKLLSTKDDYKDIDSKLMYICPNHSEYVQSISYRNLNNNEGCKYCAIERNSGEGHWNWKGGISDLKKHLRQVISPWMWESYKHYGRKCILSNSKDNIELHHIHSFNSIVRETLDSLQLPIKQNIGDYTEDELKKINDECLQLHMEYPLGVPLNSEVHFLFHSKYGFGDNTEEQWNEFVSEYKEESYGKTKENNRTYRFTR